MTTNDWIEELIRLLKQQGNTMFIDHSKWPVRAYEGPEVNKELRVSILDEQYARGWYRENYPVPAVVYETVFHWEGRGYCDMIFVDDMSYEDDPVMVACWDFHHSEKPEWRGKHQHCYVDNRADWYRKHNAWGV